MIARNICPTLPNTGLAIVTAITRTGPVHPDRWVSRLRAMPAAHTHLSISNFWLEHPLHILPLDDERAGAYARRPNMPTDEIEPNNR